MSDNKKSTQLSPQEAMLARANAKSAKSKEQLAIHEAEIAKLGAELPKQEARVASIRELRAQIEMSRQGLERLLYMGQRALALDGDEKTTAHGEYCEALTGYLVAMRNVEVKRRSHDLELAKTARVHDFDLATLPKLGEEGGDIQPSEWLEWMANKYGDQEYLESRVSTMETRRFPRPPNIIYVDIKNQSIDQYLEDLSAWSNDIVLTTTPTRVKGNDFRKIRHVHGARRFCNVLNLRIEWCSQSRDNPEEFGLHLAMIERHLEKWRRAAKAARGKKGRSKKPHTEYIEQAIKYEFLTLDEVLHFLADINYGCTFEVDRKNKVISCYPDDENEPYDLTFDAAQKALTRARDKTKK